MKTTILSFVLLFLSSAIFAQDIKKGMPLANDTLLITTPSSGSAGGTPAAALLQVVPPSPNAAAIEQYVSQPVSLYTGIPDINIPIYEIKQGSLSVPIRLMYHASGIKVNQVASWVGLGWSLDAGGVISRTIFGLPDESNPGFPFFDDITGDPNTLQYPVHYQKNNLDTFNLLKAASEGAWDLEYDRFTISSPSLNSAFIIDRNLQEAFFIPHQATKILQHPIIQFNPLDPDNPIIDATWKVKDMMGNLYIFGQYGANSAIETTSEPDHCNPSTVNSNGKTSWYLLKMISADHKDTISFEYNDYVFNHATTPQQTLTHSRSEDKTQVDEYPLGDIHFSDVSYCGFQVRGVSGKVIKKIVFRDGTVDFLLHSTPRTDVIGSVAPLQFIEVRNKAGILIKKIELEMGYFSATTGGSPLANPSYISGSAWRRLKLKKVWDRTNDCNPKPPHEFEYKQETAFFPPTHSFQQDWWGNFNGKSINDTRQILAPPLTITADPPIIRQDQVFLGADRSLNISKLAIWTLEKMTLPTGGYVLYDYEPHTHANWPPLVTDSIVVSNHTSANLNKSFTLPASSWAMIMPDFDATPCFLDGSCKVFVRNLTTLTQYELEKGLPISLVAGNYKFILETSLTSSNPVELKLRLFNALLPNQNASGIRIKSTRIHDGVNVANDLINYYNYNYGDGNLSSGLLNSVVINNFNPFSVSDISKYYWQLAPSEPCTSAVTYTISRKANPFFVGAAKGSVVSYEEVFVKQANNSGTINGKTRTRFTNYGVYTGYSPIVDYDYRNGLELSHTNYKINASLFQKAHEKINYYAFAEKFPHLEIKKLWMSKIESKKMIDMSSCPPTGTFWGILAGYVDFERLNFYQTSEFFHLSRSVERVYNQDNAAIFAETATNYYYENMNHLQMTKSVSKGENDIDSVETHYRYPLDYIVPVGSTDTQALAIKKMQELNMVAVPIETFTMKRRQSVLLTSVCLNAQLNHFRLENVNGYLFPLRYKVSALDMQPPYTVFTPSIINTATLAYNFDAKYKDRVFFEYDEKANLISQKKAEDISSTYIYEGFNKSYPIAEVVNAESDQIIHTSFEYETSATALVYPDFAKTGDKVMGKGNIITLQPPRKNAFLRQGYYYITFWAKGDVGSLDLPGFNDNLPIENSSDWKFYRHKIVVSDGTYPNPENLYVAQHGIFQVRANSTGVVFIDELRVYPEMSLMSTLTYMPLLGVSSSTDANHNTSYFEYDKYARLRLVRDFNRHILSRQKYIYNGILPCPDEN